jgi:protein-S-isoprenylcysteine O-methyltransferase Ste14
MEQASYYASVGAFAVVIICWFVFAGAFLLRKKPAVTKDAVNAPKSWLGIALQGVSYGLVWALHRTPIFSPFVGENYILNIVLQVMAVVFSVSSVLLTMAAIRELGKQWSLEARLVEGHKLVTTGPYNLVRHPIYTAMLGKLIATGIVISHWAVLLVAIAIFLIGTYIRTRFEEGLLADAFGEEFAKWKARVPGLIPFLKG